ncbi:MAG TPA: CoA transferase, partial [Dehalococcoidia bacterium]
VLQASQQGSYTARVGNRNTLLPAANGHVNLIRNTRQSNYLDVLADMTGNEAFQSPELKNAPLIGPGAAEAQEAVEALLLPWLLEHDKEEFYHRGQAAGQNFGYVASPEDLVRSEQLRERGFFVEVEHPAAGPLTYPGAPYKMSATPWLAGRAPLLGEHNAEVYVERLGLSKADLADLSKAGVI